MKVAAALVLFAVLVVNAAALRSNGTLLVRQLVLRPEIGIQWMMLWTDSNVC
jgi:hypothetical protein